jgi:hypothetical protein
MSNCIYFESQSYSLKPVPSRPSFRTVKQLRKTTLPGFGSGQVQPASGIGPGAFVVTNRMENPLEKNLVRFALACGYESLSSRP